MVTYFNLKDYLNNPTQLETANKLYTVTNIYPVDGDLVVVELTYKGPNTAMHGETQLKYFYYSGIAKVEHERFALNLRVKKEEGKTNINNYSAYTGSTPPTESGEDFGLSGYLWLGE